MPAGVDVEMYLNRPCTPECYGSPIIAPLRRHKYSYNCRNDEERCRNLDAEARFYKNEKISIANDLKESNTKVAGLERENAILKQSVKEKDKSLRESDTKVAGLERENAILKQSVKEKDKRIERITTTMQIGISEFETGLCELAFEQRAIRTQFPNHSRHLTRDRQYEKTSSNTFYELRYCENCDKCWKEISDLKAEVENLQDRYTQKEVLHQKSIRGIVCLEAAIDRLKSDIISYKGEKELLNIAVTNLKREKTALEGKISKQTSENITTRQLQKEISQLKSTIASHQRENEKLSEHAKELKKEKHQLEEKISRQTSADITTRRLQAEIIQLKSTIARHETDNEKLNEQAEELKKEKRTLENKISRQTIADITTRQLQAEIVQLKSTIARHVKENENINEQAEELKQEKRQLEERISRQSSADITTRQLQAEIAQLKSTIARHVKENEKLNEQAKELKKEKRQLEEKIRWKRTEDLFEESEKNKSHLREEIVHLKSDNVSYKNDNDMLKTQATQLKKEIQMLEEKIRQKPSDILFDPQSCQNCQNYKNEIFDLKAAVSRCKQTAELLENSEKKTRQLQDKIIDLQSDNVSYQKDIEKHKIKEKQLENEIQVLEGKLSKAASDLLTDARDCQLCCKYRTEILDLKVEVNKLRDRLSEAAGNKLRDGNPNIADLSDMNRPTSLAEKFSSLYTDEYTDAMEVIEGTMDEQASVLFLLQLLQSCYDWSRKLAEEQRHLLSVESFGFMKKYLKQPSDFQLPDSCLIYVKEFQKKISADGNNLGAVEMICLEDGMKQTNLKSNQNMKKYMKKCSLLCWMMQISDPPIYLNFDVKVGEKLDKNVYNVFTKSGSEIEFLVWPAMYIHRTGPMLAKGVAQGK